MGSLPNLNDLSKVVEERGPFHWNSGLKLKNQTTSTGTSAKTHRPVLQTRSVEHTKSYSVDKRFDQHVTLEQILAYSPMSSRSTRSSTTVAHHHFHHHHHHHHYPAQQNALYFPANTARHRDSMSSSAGTSSVRRLIAIVRSTPSQMGPVYSRHVLCRNFAALCLGHAMVTAAFVPLFALQSSISSWWWPQDSESFTPSSFYSNVDAGSLLLSSFFALGALSSLCMPTILKQLGTNWTLMMSYGGSCFFLGAHLYPKAFILIPGYLVMGLCLGPMAGAKITALMTLATKLTYVLSDEEEGEVEDAEGLGRREVIVQRLARGMQVAQDFGLIVGNMVAAFLLWYTMSSEQDKKDTSYALDSMFAKIDTEKVCGAAACPVSFDPLQYLSINFNVTFHSSTVPLVLPCKTSTMLACVFLGCCVMGLALTAALMDHIRLYVFKDHSDRHKFSTAFRTLQDTFRDPKLQLAAPLAIFIGLEQGFMYADFSKSYVVCSMGVPYVSLVFMSLGLLQSVAAFTLSMLLQHIKRYFAISVGFVFHACLLMVLLLWKPTGDDSALFYVIAAAWGVCNAIWETLSFSLLTSVYPDSWQAAVGHNFFFRYLGLSLAFGLHGAVCNYLKLYALAGALVLATAPYTWLEIRIEQQRRVNSQLSSL